MIRGRGFAVESSALKGQFLMIHWSYKHVLELVLFVWHRCFQWRCYSKDPIEDGGIRGVFRGWDVGKRGLVGGHFEGIFIRVPHHQQNIEGHPTRDNCTNPSQGL